MRYTCGEAMSSKPVEQLSQVIVRFAGDSGDGMQLTGSQFTSETALLGNDISTLPDFPAEIRAPAGSLPGVSGFQLHFADHDILTPGDAPNVLVAMNPAALKTNIKDLPKGGTLIVNADAFNERNLQKAGYAQNPLEDGSLDEYQVHAVPLTTLTVGALKDIEGVTPREAERSKNMFALGLMSWLYGRSIEATIAVPRGEVRPKRPEIAEANVKALQAGYAFGETTETFAVTYEVKPAKLAPGTYRNITGNQALSLGLVAASQLSGLPLFLGAYPITPASVDPRGARGLQALRRAHVPGGGRDRGGRRGGRRGVRRLARRHDVGRPGHRAQGRDRRARDHARAAARDLRHPARRPVDRDADEAGAGRPADGAVRPQRRVAGAGGRGAARRRTASTRRSRRRGSRSSTARRCTCSPTRTSRTAPSRGSCPTLDTLPDISTPTFATEPNAGDEFLPYLRDEQTLARPWAVPGTPGLEHRIGGLEKADRTGNISYDPENHDLMTRLRAQKVAGIAGDIPELEVDDPDGDAKVLVLGWGGTYGPVAAAARRVRANGKQVAHAHLRHLNPFPRNTGDVLRRYEKVLIPEMNLGQLLQLVRVAVPRRRDRLQPRPRLPAARGGGRRGDRGPGGRDMTEATATAT